jgi:hypothetical protein
MQGDVSATEQTRAGKTRSRLLCVESYGIMVA